MIVVFLGCCCGRLWRNIALLVPGQQALILSLLEHRPFKIILSKCSVLHFFFTNLARVYTCQTITKITVMNTPSPPDISSCPSVTPSPGISARPLSL